MSKTTDTEYVQTYNLPDPSWQKYYDRIYLDEDKKERVVRHGLLSDRLKGHGLDQFTVSHHGLVILVGPPGTGKTTLARGAVNEIARRSQSEIAFRHVRIDQLGSGQLGETPEVVANVFEEVRVAADRGVRQVLLLDEVESIATERSHLSGETNPFDVHKGVNVFLDELDSLAEEGNVFAIATSNTPEIVDQAFKSRADEALEIGLPSPKYRAQILLDVFQDFNDSLDTSLPSRPEELGDLVAITEGCSGRRIRKGVQNTLLQDGLFSDPSILTCAHVRDEFREDGDGPAPDRVVTFASVDLANAVRDMVPDAFLTDAYDRRHKTIELVEDAPVGWVAFVAGFPGAAVQADLESRGDGFVWRGDAVRSPVRDGLDSASVAAETVVRRLNPRLAVFKPSGSGPKHFFRRLRAFILETLSGASSSLAGNLDVLLSDERVEQTFYKVTRLQALERVCVTSEDLSFDIEIGYGTGHSEFMDVPEAHLVPDLDGATITLLVNGEGSRQVEEFTPLKVESVRVTADSVEALKEER